jgi:hypothetical protein
MGQCWEPGMGTYEATVSVLAAEPAVAGGPGRDDNRLPLIG